MLNPDPTFFFLSPFHYDSQQEALVWLRTLLLLCFFFLFCSRRIDLGSSKTIGQVCTLLLSGFAPIEAYSKCALPQLAQHTKLHLST